MKQVLSLTASTQSTSPAFLAALGLCIILWPLAVAHVFPRTALADPGGPFGRGLPAVGVSLALVAAPAVAALVGANAAGITLKQLGGSNLTPYAVTAVVVAVAAVVVVVLRSQGIWTPSTLLKFEPSQASGPARALKVLLRLAQVGAEELAFRGFAIAALATLMRSTWLAVVVASAAFAYAHFGSLFGGQPAKIQDVAIVFVAALMLSALRVGLPGGLWAAILVHWAWLAWTAVAT